MTQKLQRRAKIGIIGGGQLGMMLAQAAQNMGLQPVIYCQSPYEPAAQIVPQENCFLGTWNDWGAIEAFANSGIRWVLCEWENVPVEVVEFVGRFVEVNNLPQILATGRSRWAEKTMAKELDIPTAEWMPFYNDERMPDQAQVNLTGPLILKTNNGGYDGKGQ